MEQRIEITNNGLVVYTNNGKVTKDGASCDIKGEFMVSADTVASLLAHFNDTTLRTHYSWHKGCVYCVSTNEEICKELEKRSDYIDHLVDENKSLLKAIAQFNETRHFWERKMEVKL